MMQAVKRKSCIALVTIHKLSGENNLQNCKTKFSLKEYTQEYTQLKKIHETIDLPSRILLILDNAEKIIA